VARTALSLWIDQTDEGLNLGLEYCTDLFSRDTIARLLQNFEILLGGITADPDAGIERLPLLSETEHCTQLREWNATEELYSKDKCLHQLIEEQCRRQPEKGAVVIDQKQISYAELNERSNMLAHYLRNEGIGPDTFVGICLERSTEMMIGVLGILKAGGAYLPLDPDYPTERLSYMLEDSGAPVVLTQSSLLEKVPAQEKVRIICLDREGEAISKQSSATMDVTYHPKNLAYIIYTSGSTGKPKGVQVPHGAVVNFLTSMSREPGFGKDDVLLAVTTLSFDIHVLEIFLPLLVGGRVVIADRETASDGSRLLKTLKESRATVMQATPSTWRLLLAAGWEGDRNLKVLCGGEAFPRDLVKELLPRTGSVWNMYGPTETTVWSSCYHITDGEGPILIGRPIANTQIYILDRFMQPVPIGVPGELHIGGDGVTRGYLNRAELTEKQFVPDPFRSDPGARLYKTGDLARFRPDGNCEYLSRIDTQVKVRGFRIELGEIESVLSDHPSLDKCVAAVREDQPGDVRLVGYIVPRNGREVAVSDLRSHLKTKLPDYMVPQHFVELEEFPLTPAGKVDRKNLPAPDGEGSLSATEYVAPRNETEEALATIWQDLIGVSRIGIHENFFDIGGHSLLALQLISQVNQAFHLQLPLRQLFDTPTIAEFALSVENILFDEINSLTDEEAEKLLRAGG
jgi:amino acid adenylation domain-containing protein